MRRRGARSRRAGLSPLGADARPAGRLPALARRRGPGIPLRYAVRRRQQRRQRSCRQGVRAGGLEDPSARHLLAARGGAGCKPSARLPRGVASSHGAYGRPLRCSPVTSAVAIVALPATAVAIWLLLGSPLARRLVALPSEDRWHDAPTPLLGGLGIFAGVSARLRFSAASASSPGSAPASGSPPPRAPSPSTSGSSASTAPARSSSPRVSPTTSTVSRRSPSSPRRSALR